ncbi:YybH family protein [Sphingomonas bacterium]|uniref:YybH family protein n=1 Tax=Sphingomonas bacterium TaxID=1895847 RepID=UPI0015761798|nr:DUF4440 domain-containing protein [Sphingomonas bacterium]
MIGRIAAIMATVLATPATAAPAPEGAARVAVQAALDRSASGWNAGDLDRFMAVYEPGAETVYISGKTETRGFSGIRAVYARHFTAEAHGTQGELSVVFLDFHLIDAAHAFVVGRFRLHRAGAADVEGLTSLLFHRTRAGWRIIADHS